MKARNLAGGERMTRRGGSSQNRCFMFRNAVRMFGGSGRFRRLFKECRVYRKFDLGLERGFGGLASFRHD